MRGLLVFYAGLACVIEHYESFNLETEEPRVLKQIGELSFGYRVTELQSQGKWIIVSAPLAVNHTGSRTGRIYRCLYATRTCMAMDVQSPPEAGDISLGLSLDARQNNKPQILACGPTLSQSCGSNSFLNGICYLFDQRFRHTAMFPSRTRDCFTARVDLAFLIDGSGSINPDDFSRMKDFLVAMLWRFKKRDVQFAVCQFSHLMKQEFTFREYIQRNRSEELVRRIDQIRGDTYTPTAIKYAVKSLFSEEKGLRPDSTRVLVIVTDGMSNDPTNSFSEAIASADAKHLLRLVVGVGPVFQSEGGQKELAIIASNSDKKNIFSIHNYSALVSIQDRLQQRIFSIEGTNGTVNASSFQMEMSQEGLSCLLPSDGAVLGSVGSYGWSGGILLYNGQNETFLNESSGDFQSSYLGYSVQLATRAAKTYYIAGAPRYQHRGEVVIFRNESALWQVSQHIPGEQIGSYFGAELCVMDLERDGESDLLLIGVPMFHERDQGGKVEVCSMSPEGIFSCSSSLWGARGGSLGRFGSALAPLQDLNGDGLSDLAVGAPLEDDMGGCVYIFQGMKSGIRSEYSQRLLGSKVSPTLKYFGTSVSGRMDVTDDGLTDLVVGSEGAVAVFRSRPVLDVVPWFTSSPQRIPSSLYACSMHYFSSGPTINSSLCFNLTRVTAGSVGDPRGTINYTLRLDPQQQTARAVFETSARRLDGSVQVWGWGKCLPFKLLLPRCVHDYFTPILISVNFTLEGEKMVENEGLRPILNDKCNTTHYGQLFFERDCALGSLCPDYLRILFNFSSGSELVLGRDTVLRVQVSLENAGDDSYMAQLNFHHPNWLNFKRVVLDQAGSSPVACSGEVKGERGESETLTCLVRGPVFLRGSRVTFEAEFDIETPDSEDRNVNFTIVSTSQSPHHITNESTFSRQIVLRYAADVSAAQLNFTRHAHFTLGQQEVQLVKHAYQVKNSGRWPLPIVVTFSIPVGTGTHPIWNVTASERSSNPISTCLPASQNRVSVRSSSHNFMESYLLPDCGIALCLEIRCQVKSLKEGLAIIFDVEGKVMGSVVAEIHQGGRLGLWSRIEVGFDKTWFADRSPGDAHFRQAVVVTDIEVNPNVSLAPLIAGGTIGGLLLLTLVVFALFKFGFFRHSMDSGDTGRERLGSGDEAESAAE
ncbi:integrin alpha-X-like [Hypanus sabinus]|uniref:integrin alpha-X-like n=1 Tax=Hypanus sabinus TaxID=79690 RepID=UPI0028C3BA6F|nr:integrin alpha-X-like [Hypanus sabinus]